MISVFTEIDLLKTEVKNKDIIIRSLKEELEFNKTAVSELTLKMEKFKHYKNKCKRNKEQIARLKGLLTKLNYKGNMN